MSDFKSGQFVMHKNSAGVDQPALVVRCSQNETTDPTTNETVTDEWVELVPLTLELVPAGACSPFNQEAAKPKEVTGSSEDVGGLTEGSV